GRPQRGHCRLQRDRRGLNPRGPGQGRGRAGQSLPQGPPAGGLRPLQRGGCHRPGRPRPPAQLPLLPGGKRLAGEELADQCHAWGTGVLPDPLPYLTYFQLYLNRDRALWKNAYETYLALQMDRTGPTADCLQAVGVPPRERDDLALKQTMADLMAKHSRF